MAIYRTATTLQGYKRPIKNESLERTNEVGNSVKTDVFPTSLSSVRVVHLYETVFGYLLVRVVMHPRNHALKWRGEIDPPPRGNEVVG